MKSLAHMKSEKGAASVLVLSIILVLTALGTIALISSVANIMLGDRSRHWTAAYYTLDQRAEQQVKEIDKALKEAEEAARKYVQGNLSTTTTAVTITGNPATEMTLPARTFFYDNRFEKLYPRTLNDFLFDAAYASNPAGAEAAYQEYRKNSATAYNKDLMERVFFYFVSKYLAPSSSPPLTIDIDNKFPVLDTYDKTNPLYYFKWDGAPLNTRTGVSPTDGYIQVQIEVRADPAEPNFDPNDKKKVNVVLDVLPTLYTAELQTQNSPYQGNPIYTYALASQGTITVGVNSTGTSISGDIYSSAAGSGLAVTTNSSIDIYGNVYAAGNVHVTGNYGKLGVHRISATTYDRSMKNDVYYKQGGLDGEYYFDVDETKTRVSASVAADFDNYAERTPPTSIVPLIYKDHSFPGNVYCNSLSVDNTVTIGGTIEVTGNVLAMDDLQMDGQYSTITIGTPGAVNAGNFVGLCSETDPATGNPNNNSSVINNQAYDADGNSVSKIYLYGNNIIPGTAFTEFRAGSYYQTAESATARLPEIFNTYVSASTSGGIAYSTAGGDVFYMKNIPVWTAKLTGFLADLGLIGGVNTNIFSGSDTYTGYSLGAALIQRDEANPANVFISTNITNYSANFLAYNNMTLALQEIHKEKTRQLGTSNPSSFSYYINDDPAITSRLNGNGIHYYDSDATIDVSTIPDGIIYCKHNLVIEATGSSDRTFEGAIICEGNIDIVSPDIRILYKEDVIKGTLSSNRLAREFFKPLMGNPVAWTTDYSVGSSTRSELKRVLVREWKEKQDS